MLIPVILEPKGGDKVPGMRTWHLSVPGDDRITWSGIVIVFGNQLPPIQWLILGSSSVAMVEERRQWHHEHNGWPQRCYPCLKSLIARTAVCFLLRLSGSPIGDQPEVGDAERAVRSVRPIDLRVGWWHPLYPLQAVCRVRQAGWKGKEKYQHMFRPLTPSSPTNKNILRIKMGLSAPMTDRPSLNLQFVPNKLRSVWYMVQVLDLIGHFM